MDDREAEGGRLAGARLRAGHQVAPGQADWDRVALDRRRLRVLAARDVGHQRGPEVDVGKRRDGLRDGVARRLDGDVLVGVEVDPGVLLGLEEGVDLGLGAVVGLKGVLLAVVLVVLVFFSTERSGVSEEGEQERERSGVASSPIEAIGRQPPGFFAAEEGTSRAEPRPLFTSSASGERASLFFKKRDGQHGRYRCGNSERGRPDDSEERKGRRQRSSAIERTTASSPASSPSSRASRAPGPFADAGRSKSSSVAKKQINRALPEQQQTQESIELECLLRRRRKKLVEFSLAKKSNAFLFSLRSAPRFCPPCRRILRATSQITTPPALSRKRMTESKPTTVKNSPVVATAAPAAAVASAAAAVAPSAAAAAAIAAAAVAAAAAAAAAAAKGPAV